ncbi:caspase family protein [Candidatus Woesearchaeota archaeon]|nr:caspase family protein [Candidatus Woesearchaeota archaeon]
MGLESIVQGNGSIALVDKPSLLEKAGEKAGRAAGAGLDLLARAGYNGLHAANPVRDVKAFLTAGYNLVRGDWSIKKYKEELKQGKFLGKGNASTLLFYGGMFAAGFYVPLLVTRALIGAGGYIGKEAITYKHVRKNLVNILDESKESIARLGSILGIDKEKTKKVFSKQNLESFFKKLKDDNFYRNKVAPYVLDAAIGLKGYASLVGAKWFSGTVGKAAEKLAKSTKSKYIKGVAGKIAKVGNFGKNASSDLLSLLVGIQGGYHLYSSGVAESAVNGELFEDVKKKVQYVTSGEIFDDAKHYTTVELPNMARMYVASGVDSFNRFVADIFGIQPRRPFDPHVPPPYVPPDDEPGRGHGREPDRPYGPERPSEPDRPGRDRDRDSPDIPPFPDFPDFGRDHDRDGGDRGRDRHEPETNPPLDKMKDINNGPADAPVADNGTPSEKYAVVVAGYDAEHRFADFFGSYGPRSRERFLLEQIRIYNQLLDLGFKKENIRVLIPDGLNPKNPASHYPDGFDKLKEAYRDTSYNHDATEANLERTLAEMAKKVDSNDVFVLYLSTHGNLHRSYGTDADGNFAARENSFAAIDNGKDIVHDHELARYVRGINGGRELYLVDACHSGHFAKELGRGRDIVMTASMMHQPGVMDEDGYSFGIAFFDELKKKGLTVDTKVKTIFDSLAEGMKKYKQHFRYSYYGKNQTPCFGTGDDARRFDWYRVPARGAAQPSPAPAVVPHARAA